MPGYAHRRNSDAVAAAELVRKRLFVFCDGTWQDGVNKTRPLTNIATLARCLQSVDGDGCLQIVYYDSGVGSVTSALAQLVDGATGRGITTKIRNAYSFLSHNWNFREGRDEIILVGFSRGAFTVQCLAAFIVEVGLLQKQHLYYLRGLFTLWANKKIPKAETKFIEARDRLQRDGLLHTVNITACAVWDTVSSLGSSLQLRPRPLAFVGKDVPQGVRYAFHALALDEERSKFRPVLWKSKHEGTSLSQCWFRGTHSDVGGNGDVALGAFSLLWMIGRLHENVGVAFDENEIAKYLKHRFLEWDFNIQRLCRTIRETKTLTTMRHYGQPTRHAWYWWLLGHQVRSQYLHSSTRVPTYIHFTARLTMAQKLSNCRPLRSWFTSWTAEQASGSARVQWRPQSEDQTLDEHSLDKGDTEYDLLRRWSSGEFKILPTDRAAFAGVQSPGTAEELQDMALFLDENMKFENNKLSEGILYSGT